MDEDSAGAGPPDHAGTGGRESPPRAPRWVKVSGVIAAVAVLLLVILLLTGGNHGPGRHLDGGERRSPATEHSGPHP